MYIEVWLPQYTLLEMYKGKSTAFGKHVVSVVRQMNTFPSVSSKNSKHLVYSCFTQKHTKIPKSTDKASLSQLHIFVLRELNGVFPNKILWNNEIGTVFHR